MTLRVPLQRRCASGCWRKPAMLQLVQRLAPRQPGEAEAARRARSLFAALAQSVGMQSQPLLQVRRPLLSWQYCHSAG